MIVGAVTVVVAVVYRLVLRAPGIDRALGVPPGLRIAVGVVTALALFGASLALGYKAQVAEPLPTSEGRLAELRTNRGAYWKVALESFAARPLVGGGSGSFRVDWRREREIEESVMDAHSLYFETLSELGLVGAALLGGFVVTGVVGVARLGRRRPGDPPAPGGDSRAGGVRHSRGSRLGLGDAGGQPGGATALGSGPPSAGGVGDRAAVLGRPAPGLRSGAMGSGRSLRCTRTMGAFAGTVPRPPGRSALAQQARMVKVLAGATLKPRYADATLGYFWTLAQPLGLFAVLYLVFGHAFRLNATIPNYAIFLLIGIALFQFFSEATTSTMAEIVGQSQLMRKLPLPPLVIVVAVSVSSLIDFALHAVALAVFVAISGIAPHFDWLMLIPLVLELYVFVLGVSMILAALHAQFRDMQAIWGLATRMFFYGSAIFFPVSLLPDWARSLVLGNPFGQVMQDVRALVLGGQDILTVPEAMGGVLAYAVPVALTALLFAFGYVFFQRRQPWFAEGL